jgi:hypothetical protein
MKIYFNEKTEESKKLNFFKNQVKSSSVYIVFM